MKVISLCLLFSYLILPALTSQTLLAADESPLKKPRRESSPSYQTSQATPLFILNRYESILTLTFPALDSFSFKTTIEEISLVSDYFRTMFTSEMSEASARQIDMENNDPDFGPRDISLATALIIAQALNNGEATRILCQETGAYDEMGRAGLLVHALRQANFFGLAPAPIAQLFFDNLSVSRAHFGASALSDVSGLAGRIYISLFAGAAEADLPSFLAEYLPRVIPYLQEDLRRVITHASLWHRLLLYAVEAGLSTYVEQLLSLFEHPDLPEKMPAWKEYFSVLMQAISLGQRETVKVFLNHALSTDIFNDEWLFSVLCQAAKADQKEIISDLLADTRVGVKVADSYFYGSMFRSSFNNHCSATSEFLIDYASRHGFKISPSYISAALKDAAEAGETQTFCFLLNLAGDETISTYSLFGAMDAATRNNDKIMVQSLLDYFSYHQLFGKYMQTRTHGCGGFVQGPAFEMRLLLWSKPEIISALDTSVFCSILQQRPTTSNDSYLQALATAELKRRGISPRSCTIGSWFSWW